MTGFKPTKIDPELNIHGTSIQTDTLVPSDELHQLGSLVLGQTGIAATISSVSGVTVTITGLTGITSDSIARVIYITGAANSNNNGIFPIISVISSSSVTYFNSAAVFPDANSGNISWQERNNYSLQDDLNYTRTDRSNIKGVSYYSNLPTYQRPDNIGTSLPTNLINVTGHTTDAVSYLIDNIYYGATAVSGSTNLIITSIGNLKHSDAINTLGVPVFDAGPFSGDYLSCFVTIQNPAVGGGSISVLTGPHTGEKIFGITHVGTSVSPNSIDIEFYSVPIATPVSVATVTPYTWEPAQITLINLIYGYNQRLDQLSKNAFRTVPAIGSIGTSLDLDFLLTNIPTKINNTYSNTLVSGKIIQEKWVDTGNTNFIKIIDYTYTGNYISTEVRKVYDSMGVTILAQMTIYYNILNNSVVSETITRDI